MSANDSLDSEESFNLHPEAIQRYPPMDLHPGLLPKSPFTDLHPRVNL
eukprot:gene19124-13807_t